MVYGEAVALRKDGRLQTGKLDHCSCYGPFDGWAGATPVTVEELFAESDNIHDRQWGDPLRAQGEGTTQLCIRRSSKVLPKGGQLRL
jgi:hypothetical protein